MYKYSHPLGWAIQRSLILFSLPLFDCRSFSLFVLLTDTLLRTNPLSFSGHTFTWVFASVGEWLSAVYVEYGAAFCNCHERSVLMSTNVAVKVILTIFYSFPRLFAIITCKLWQFTFISHGAMCSPRWQWNTARSEERAGFEHTVLVHWRFTRVLQLFQALDIPSIYMHMMVVFHRNVLLHMHLRAFYGPILMTVNLSTFPWTHTICSAVSSFLLQLRGIIKQLVAFEMRNMYHHWSAECDADARRLASGHMKTMLTRAAVDAVVVGIVCVKFGEWMSVRDCAHFLLVSVSFASALAFTERVTESSHAKHAAQLFFSEPVMGYLHARKSALAAEKCARGTVLLHVHEIFTKKRKTENYCLSLSRVFRSSQLGFVQCAKYSVTLTLLQMCAVHWPHTNTRDKDGKMAEIRNPDELITLNKLCMVQVFLLCFCAMLCSLGFNAFFISFQFTVGPSAAGRSGRWLD